MDRDLKEDVQHVELNETLRVAADEELGEGQGVWATFRKNPRAFWVLVIVLVSFCCLVSLFTSVFLLCYVQSTAILQGAELSMSGSMLGSQAFCKVMGAWDETSQAYVVAPGHVSA